MSFVIVPNELADWIHAKIHEAFDRANVPTEVREILRDDAYHQMLAYYDANGVVPECDFTKKSETDND